MVLGRQSSVDDSVLILDRALKELGGYPDGRLRWLMAVGAENPNEWSDERWAMRRSQVRYLAERNSLVSGGGTGPLRLVNPSQNDREEILHAIEEVRRCLLDLASQRLHEARFPSGGFVFAVTELGLDRRFIGPLPAALVQAAIDLVAAAGPLRLRFCPHRPEGSETPCARLFLAERRQKFCSLEHSRAAAWAAYIQRRGGTRAKDPHRPQRRSTKRQG